MTPIILTARHLPRTMRMGPVCIHCFHAPAGIAAKLERIARVLIGEERLDPT